MSTRNEKNPFAPPEHSFLPQGPCILNSREYVDAKGRRCAEGGSFFKVKLKKKVYFDQGNDNDQGTDNKKE